MVGTILSNESVSIKPEVTGKIIFIGFTEGEHVELDTILFKLDTDLLDAEYQEVKANYNFAKTQYRRAKNLKKSNVIPEEKYDDDYRAYINAQSKLNTLATRLKKHAIKAPFKGIVGARAVSVGDYVAVGQHLVNIEDLAIVKAEFYVPERYLRNINTGQTVRIQVQALADNYGGTIYLIDPRIQPATRSALIRAKIPNPEQTLRPGMFCTVKVVLATRANALLVPQEALVSRGEKQFLFINKDARAEIRPVTTGIFSGERVEIISGLEEGEAVIVTGVQKIMPGMSLVEAQAGKTIE